MDTNKRIKQRREELNMSQEELAFKLGYKSRSSVNKVENSRDISLKLINQYAKALDCDPAWLLGWDEEPISMETDEERHQELLAKYVESVYLANEMSSYIDKLKELPPSLRQVVYATIDGLYNAKEEQ